MYNKYMLNVRMFTILTSSSHVGVTNKIWTLAYNFFSWNLDKYMEIPYQLAKKIIYNYLDP